MSDKQCFMGLDIGYSNLKVAIGGQGVEPRFRLLPGGAAPLADLPHKLGGGVDDDGVLLVDVAGEKFAACVDQSRLDSARQLHPDDPSTRQYRALFRAALLLTGVELSINWRQDCRFPGRLPTSAGSPAHARF